MVQFLNFSSGSKGNCSLFSCGGEHWLIDCGISYRRLVQSLASVGLTTGDITGVIITHLHHDHISGLPVWWRDRNFLFLIPLGLGKSFFHLVEEASFSLFVPSSQALVAPERIVEIIPGESYTSGNGTTFRLFPLSHDAPSTVGISFTYNSRRFTYLTDLGEIGEEISPSVEGAEFLFLEANHEPELVAKSFYPELVKRRILSPRGHLSNQQAIAFLESLRHPPVTLAFGHLSENNNSPQLLLERYASSPLPSRILRVHLASAHHPLVLTWE